MERLNVVLVGGLHATARQAAVERLLRTVPGSVALHHDLASAAVADRAPDGAVRDGGGVLDTGEAPLVNDCACCALREDLVPELERLAAGRTCRLAIVELWDSVEPKAMAEVVTGCGSENLALTGVITAVDPALLLPYLGCGDDLAEAGLAAAASDQRTVADTWARQLEYAPVLAHQVDVESGELAAAAIAGFDVEAAAARQHPACALLPQDADAEGVATLVWQHTRPFHPERLYSALEDLTCAAARSRGRFWLADRPDTLLSWDAAGGALCVENAGPWLASLPEAAWEMVPPVRRAAAALDWHPEHGDRAQHLVFTSPGLDREGLASLLRSCVLTDAEYAGGPKAWKSLPPAFDALLDPVS
jgi:G3E family GTPase